MDIITTICVRAISRLLLHHCRIPLMLLRMPLMMPLLLLVLLLQQVEPTGASCEDDEVGRCRRAAEAGKLMDLKSGGVCELKKYGSFTHSCVLPDYDQDVNHCCCHLPNKVLCCSYHQAGVQYRCNEAQDVAISSQELSSQSLAAIVIGVLAGVLLLVGIIVCLRKRQERKKASKKKRQQESESESAENSEEVPLSTPATSTRPIIREAGEEKVLFYQPTEGDEVGPTAPPLEGENEQERLEDSDEVFPLPSRPSGTMMSQPCPECLSDIPPYSRSVSYPDADRHVVRPPRPRFHSCASCPPPPYAEHHHDRLISCSSTST